MKLREALLKYISEEMVRLLELAGVKTTEPAMVYLQDGEHVDEAAVDWLEVQLSRGLRRSMRFRLADGPRDFLRRALGWRSVTQKRIASQLGKLRAKAAVREARANSCALKANASPRSPRQPRVAKLPPLPRARMPVQQLQP